VSLWRLYLVSLLVLVPIATFVGAGIVALWRTGQYLWLWWLLPVCWLPAWLLARRWRQQLVAPAAMGDPSVDYWTARDREAWEVVQAAQRNATEISAEQLLDPPFYLQTAMELGIRVAKVYHPKAKDPLGSRTVLEILTVAQLAIEDSHRWIADYVPGSHLLTIDQWRLLAKTPRWWRLASNVGWLASIAINPLNVTRFVVSKLALGSATKQLQENALAWGYAVFVGRVGFYLIEMNSGRLRIGADRYKNLTRRGSGKTGLAPSGKGENPEKSALAKVPVPILSQPWRADAVGGKSGPDESSGSAKPQTAASEPCEVVVAVVGQVKAGKSSVINALLGQRAAESDVLPATRDVRRYRVHQLDQPDSQWTLLDTPGYAEAGATEQQTRAIRAALAEADLVLLVMKVTSPARQADAAMLSDLTALQRNRLNRKPAPVLGVLTHIDQLSPVMEWSPPYDWKNPTVRKEEQIQESVQYHRELLGSMLAGIVPVCSDVEHEREFGIALWLLPAMLQLLGEARGCAVLRIMGAEVQSGQVRRIFTQLAQAGAALLQTQRL
jgi:uncharacterized protein